jgi:hypothetical protein
MTDSLDGGGKVLFGEQLKKLSFSTMNTKHHLGV